MKVGLISLHSFYNPGGVKRHILGLFNEFKKKGINAKIIAPRRKMSEKYGKDIILLGTSFPITFSGSQADLDINFNPLAIETTLKREKFNVLHFHNAGLPSSLQILLSPSAAGCLNILTFHSNITGSNFLKNFPTFLYILNRICQWKVDGVIGVAPLILEYFKGYKGPKIIIPNGIDTNEFNPGIAKIEKFCDGKINILFVGRIEERKGLIYLLRAFKSLERNFSNLRLIIVGEGPLKEKCQKYVKENNLKEVFFEGQITEGLASYYRTADIFVSPAIFGESFGLVLLEAMACGIPVVAFANEGYEKFLKGKTSGTFLARSRDWRALAKKIEILIKNPDLREDIGKKGISEAEEYSWGKVADRVLDFYKLCRENKIKKRKNKFSLKKTIGKMASKDILDLIDHI
jgi:phosphatidylinositol alpha-mannosyltransferase